MRGLPDSTLTHVADILEHDVHDALCRCSKGEECQEVAGTVAELERAGRHSIVVRRLVEAVAELARGRR